MTYPYETATAEQKAVGSWWWCVHHEVHFEQLTEPIEARVDYIRTQKPERERETRLRNLAPVLHPERLPQQIIKARAECDKARAKYDKAGAECDKAGAECDKAWAECDKARAKYDKARAKYDKARAEYDKAWAECDKAGAKYDKARAKYDKAGAECEPELMALHKEEYPDTQWNGMSIFSEGK